MDLWQKCGRIAARRRRGPMALGPNASGICRGKSRVIGKITLETCLEEASTKQSYR